VRAKVKIKAAAIPFEVPERHNWQERLSFVVERMGRRRGALRDAGCVHTGDGSAHAFGAEQGLALLESLPEERLRDHQPYWAARGHLLGRIGRTSDAKAAYERAIGLCDDQAVRAHLWERWRGL